MPVRHRNDAELFLHPFLASLRHTLARLVIVNQCGDSLTQGVNIPGLYQQPRPAMFNGFGNATGVETNHGHAGSLRL
jgi:hypothetical protein